jgi:hypothetical protein
MTPQPLSKIGRPEDLRIGVEHVSKVNPELGSLAMQLIAVCSYMELGLTQIAAFLSGGDYTITAAMLHSLTGARQHAIDAIASSALEEAEPGDWRLYQRVMKRVNSINQRRNLYAHHLWAILPARPELLVLVEDKDVALVEASTAYHYALIVRAVRRRRTAGGNLTLLEEEQFDPRRSLNLDAVYVFTKVDITHDLARAREAADLVTLLKWSLGNDQRVIKIARNELARIFDE